MDKLDINSILERENIYNNIKNILLNFNENKKNLQNKRGIYIYGPPGCGKTHFLTKLLDDINFEKITYDSGEIRNKNIIDLITKNNISNKSVISILKNEIKPTAILMDEIDSMNNGDKGGINSLIKIIRPKKTKKQKGEEICNLPIICIGNNFIDKKIKELIKVSYTFELKLPNDKQIANILENYQTITNKKMSKSINKLIAQYSQNDMRKLKIILDLYESNPDFFDNPDNFSILAYKLKNEDTKETTHKLIIEKHTSSNHNNLICDTERTIVALLWHENIIDTFISEHNEKNIILYLKFLNNICFADYIDRITFQKQIWQFNEISSLIKILFNNYLYHNSNLDVKKISRNSIRFTKILTKYSTEYNNNIFINNLCQIFSIDKKDILSFFLKLKEYDTSIILNMLENFEVNKLDITRLYRFISKLDNEIDLESEENTNSDNELYCNSDYNNLIETTC